MKTKTKTNLDWTQEEIFEDPETGLYGIGRDGVSVAYEPTFTKEQAEFVLYLHKLGIGFEQILANAEAAGFDMAVAP